MPARRMRDPPRGKGSRILIKERPRTPGQGLETAGTSLARPRPQAAGQARADTTRPIDVEREQDLHGLGRRRPVADRRDGAGARGSLDAGARPAGGRRVHVWAAKSAPARLDLFAELADLLTSQGLALKRKALWCSTR